MLLKAATKRLTLCYMALGVCLAPPVAAAGKAQFAGARERMVAEQIEARGVSRPAVLAAMRAVPRHRFVPERWRPLAYTDRPLPIGEGQTISQPYIVALMTELAEVEPGEKVLEVGTGSGYQAAVLAELGAEVYTIEILPGLAARAEETLRALGYEAVRARTGDGYLGWPEAAPFDAVLVTAAPDRVPEPLTAQLAEGGVMVVPVGPAGGIQKLLRIRKRAGRILEEEMIPVRFVPLIHPERPLQ